MIKDLEKNEYVVSTDLSLCACLCCLGYRIEDIDKVGQKAYFKISKDKKTDELIKKFWAHKLKVDPLSYSNSLKEIKTQIYNLD